MAILRHHDYQLTVASVPVGGVRSVPLRLDTDAPFLLRLVRSRNIGLSGWRFKTPALQWQSTHLRTDTAPNNAASFRPTRGALIWPPLKYPIGATIEVDIGNSTGAPITNARLLFRGSKVFADGALPAPGYPARMSVLPFTFPVEVASVGIAETRRDNQLVIQQENADFVLQYAVCDPFSLGVDGGLVAGAPGAFAPVTGTITQVFVQLKDESRKLYSNEPIHIDDLFGQGLPTPAGVGAADDQVLFFPGRFMPQIYLPRQHSLYFDVFRQDTSGIPVTLNFRFSGHKVFAR